MMLQPADADLLRRDRALTGLALLLDADLFASRLSRSLPEAGIRSAHLTYVAYRPRRTCVAAYTVGTAAGAVPVFAHAYSTIEANRFAKDVRRRSDPGALGHGSVVWADCGTVAWMFPNDPRVRAIRPLLREGRRRRMLRAIGCDRAAGAATALRTLRYKPERRYVAALVDSSGRPAIKLKLYSRPAFEAARNAVFVGAAGGSLRLARCLGASSCHALLAFEWIDGRLLSEGLANGEIAREALGEVGAALAELHARGLARVAPEDRAVQAQAVRTLASRTAFLCPRLARRILRLADARLADSRPPAAARAIHGDFYAKQVLVAPHGVAFLDLDRATQGDPLRDVGLFIAHLERDALRDQLPANAVARAGGAFVEGYALTGGRVDRTDLARHVALGLFGLLIDPFRNREAEWPARTEALLARAEAIARTARAAQAMQAPTEVLL